MQINSKRRVYKNCQNLTLDVINRWIDYSNRHISELGHTSIAVVDSSVILI